MGVCTTETSNVPRMRAFVVLNSYILSIPRPSSIASVFNNHQLIKMPSRPRQNQTVLPSRPKQRSMPLERMPVEEIDWELTDKLLANNCMYDYFVLKFGGCTAICRLCFVPVARSGRSTCGMLWHLRLHHPEHNAKYKAERAMQQQLQINVGKQQ